MSSATVETLLARLNPNKTYEVMGIDWAKAEAQIGRLLPADYKQLMTHLPPCTLQGSLNIWSPAMPDEGDTPNTWLLYVQNYSSAMAEFRRNWDDCPFSLYPKDDGLLPWGDINSEMIFCWYTVGIPDSWPVIVVERNMTEWSAYPGTVVQCIDDLLSGTADIGVLECTAEVFLDRPVVVDPDF